MQAPPEPAKVPFRAWATPRDLPSTHPDDIESETGSERAKPIIKRVPPAPIDVAPPLFETPTDAARKRAAMGKGSRTPPAASRIGTAGRISATPSVVNIRGFTPGEVQEVHVAITNVSADPIRVSVVAPATSEFQARLLDKKGLLPPGLSETVVVRFCAGSVALYRDAIVCVCGSDRLSVPLHAFPSLGSREPLPRRIDLGAVVLGESATRTVAIPNASRVGFEYSIAPTETDPWIEVSPLAGVVPAEGVAEITFRATGGERRTMRMAGTFRVSEVGFAAYPFTVVATCVGGMGAEVEEASARLARHEAKQQQQQKKKKKQQERKANLLPPPNRRRTQSARGASDSTPASASPADPVAEITGRKLRGGVFTQAGLNALLLHDEARAKEKEEALARKREIEEAATDPNLTTITTTTTTTSSASLRRAQNLRFKHEMAAEAERRKAREIRAGVADPGQPLLTVAELESRITARRAGIERSAMGKQHRDVERIEPLVSASRACVPSKGENSSDSLHAVRPTFEAHGAGKVRLTENVRMYQRLQRMFHTALIRRRADARLAKMRSFFARYGRDRDTLHALVDEESRVRPSAALDAWAHTTAVTAADELARPQPPAGLVSIFSATAAAAAAAPPPPPPSRSAPPLHDPLHRCGFGAIMPGVMTAARLAVDPSPPGFEDRIRQAHLTAPGWLTAGLDAAAVARGGEHLPALVPGRDPAARVRTGMDHEACTMGVRGLPKEEEEEEQAAEVDTSSPPSPPPSPTPPTSTHPRLDAAFLATLGIETDPAAGDRALAMFGGRPSRDASATARVRPPRAGLSGMEASSALPGETLSSAGLAHALAARLRPRVRPPRAGLSGMEASSKAIIDTPGRSAARSVPRTISEMWLPAADHAPAFTNVRHPADTARLVDPDQQSQILALTTAIAAAAPTRGYDSSDSDEEEPPLPLAAPPPIDTPGRMHVSLRETVEGQIGQAWAAAGKARAAHAGGKVRMATTMIK